MNVASRPVRIGNALGFWGDRLDAAREMLELEPELDFLTLDFLAEVSMSILAVQRSRDPAAGWPRDFVEIFRSIVPYWQRGGRCRIITNAGGLSPMGCARACSEVLKHAGCGDRRIAVVSGDDVLDLVRAGHCDKALLRNLDTAEPIAAVCDRLVTANAYLGAQPMAEALARGADLVITGRVADPSLTAAACVHAFGWSWDDWDRLAGATVAGHIIECGTQVTGGISTDWLEVPDVERIGFPIAEVAEDGSCVITKPRGTGGCVCPQTVKEQLVYEIGDPDCYLSPDVTVSFLSLHLDHEGRDRVRVSGVRGRPAPPTYKVSATYQDGFRAQGQLTMFGASAVAKARRAGQAVLDRLRRDGAGLRESVIECLGAGACWPQGVSAVGQAACLPVVRPTGQANSLPYVNSAIAEQAKEVVLRIAVADDSREAVERFARELMPLVTAGPQGTTGYAEGRPRVHPLFRFWPCLIERERARPVVEVLEGKRGRGGGGERESASAESSGQRPTKRPEFAMEPLPLSPSPPLPLSAPPRRLADIAYARSGDKGIHANIGLIARRPEDFSLLCREATPDRVASHLGIVDASLVQRYEMPNLGAVNFVLRGVLRSSLQVDAQGKALGQVLLEMPLDENPQ